MTENRIRSFGKTGGITQSPPGLDAGISAAGFEFASGTAVSGASITFTKDDGTGVSLDTLVVSGLSFSPKWVRIYYASTGAFTQAMADTVFYNLSKISFFNGTSHLFIKLTGGTAYISADGFRLPVSGFGVTFNWEAGTGTFGD